MATITKSIGTSSRDYSTITAWEADLDSGSYASGDIAKGELYNDSVFTESPVINGGGTVGLSEIILIAATGNRHNGTAGTGVRLNGGIQLAVAINNQICWLEIYGGESASVRAPINTNYSSTTINCLIKNCIIHDVSTSDSTSNRNGGICVDTSRGYITNCIVYDITQTGAGTRKIRGILCAAGIRIGEIYNCTVDRVTSTNASNSGSCYGIEQLTDNSVKKCKNCISTTVTHSGSGTTRCFELNAPSSAVLSHNLSSDTSASGTGSLTSKTNSNQFVSVTNGSEDYHLKSGADAIDVGTDLVTTPTDVNYDIDNRDRDSEGDTWDIGADEYVSSLTAVGQERQCLWNLKAAVGLARQQLWNVKNTIGISLQEIWNLRAIVGKNTQDVWNTRALASLSNQFLWSQRVAVNKSSQEIWNTRAAVGLSNQFIWNVAGLAIVNHDIQLIWNQRQTTNSSKQCLWNTKNIVGKNIQEIWNIRNSVGIPLSCLWILRQNVTNNKQLIWTLKALSGKEGQILWNNLSLASSNKQAIWNVKNSVGKAVQELWNTRNTIGKSNQLLWNNLVVSIIIDVQEFVLSVIQRKIIDSSIRSKYNIQAIKED